MLYRRFTPYIVTICIIAFFSLCYVGYKIYQNHVEFKGFMSKVVAFQESFDENTETLEHIEDEVEQPSPDPQGKNVLLPPVKVKIVAEEEYSIEEEGPSVSVPMEDLVLQRVQTPDGKTRTIYVMRGREIEEGGILSGNVLNQPTPLNLKAMEGQVIRKSDIPADEDVDSYLEKVHWASAHGVSVKEYKRMVENGEIQPPQVVSRSPVEEFIDADYLFHDHEDLPRSSATLDNLEDIDEDAGFPPVRSEAPPVPSEPIHLKENQTPTPLTTENLETQLKEQLSPERYDKAQQLIDQYGTEEGLRRFREMDPEAAQQFEQERRSPPTREIPDETESPTQ